MAHRRRGRWRRRLGALAMFVLFFGGLAAAVWLSERGPQEQSPPTTGTTTTGT